MASSALRASIVTPADHNGRGGNTDPSTAIDEPDPHHYPDRIAYPGFESNADYLSHHDTHSHPGFEPHGDRVTSSNSDANRNGNGRSLSNGVNWCY